MLRGSHSQNLTLETWSQVNSKSFQIKKSLKIMIEIFCKQCDPVSIRWCSQMFLLLYIKIINYIKKYKYHSKNRPNLSTRSHLFKLYIYIKPATQVWVLWWLADRFDRGSSLFNFQNTCAGSRMNVCTYYEGSCIPKY